MKISLSVLLFFLSVNCSQAWQSEHAFPSKLNRAKSDRHVRFLGSKAFAIIPGAYEYYEDLSRFQKNEKLYIQIIDAQGSPFEQMKNSLTRENIESTGAKIDVLADINVHGFDGKYGEGPSKFEGETKIMMAFGDDDFSCMVVGVCKDSDPAGKEELKSIFKSIFYDKKFDLDPFELANFDFDHSITGFRYAGTFSNMFMFTESGKNVNPEEAAEPKAMMMFAALPQMNKAKAEYHANYMIARYELSGIHFESKTVYEMEIGKYKAFVLETEIQIEEQAGVFYQAVFLGEKRSLFFLGMADKNMEEMLLKFKKTAVSIQIK